MSEREKYGKYRINKKNKKMEMKEAQRKKLMSQDNEKLLNNLTEGMFEKNNFETNDDEKKNSLQTKNNEKKNSLQTKNNEKNNSIQTNKNNNIIIEEEYDEFNDQYFEQEYIK